MKTNEIFQNNSKSIPISKRNYFYILQNELGFLHNEILIEHWIEKNQHNESLFVWRINNDDKWKYTWDYRELMKNFGPDFKTVIKRFLIELKNNN